MDDNKLKDLIENIKTGLSSLGFKAEGTIYKKEVKGGNHRQLIGWRINQQINYNIILKLEGNESIEKELFNKKEIGYVRKDLISQEIVFRESGEFYKIVRPFKNFLNIKDYATLTSAASILHQQTMGNKDVANKFIKKFHMAYNERGRRIYNRLRAGLLEKEFLPILESLKIIFKNDTFKIKTDFQKYFDNNIEFHSHAIFVNEYNADENIIEEINRRFSEPLNNYVKIYSERPQAKIASKKFIKENKGFVIEYEKREIKKLKDKIIIIRRNQK